MLTLHPRIAAGDLVIVYEDFRTMSAVRVKPPQVFSCRFGKFPHASMVGMRYGERMGAAAGGGGNSSGHGGGYVTLLPPSPELWTETLPHRTQILYIADISMIALQLELLPDSIIIEAGTGSGSLSHALARTLSTRGHLHTFEFNEKRAQLAQAEFVANDLGSRVTCRHGDVCAEDFSYATAAGLTHESVDGAIFDLPQPWDAIRLAAPFIKPGGRLCVFSPCIEQVARALDALREGGFTGSEVIEAIVRTHEVRPAPPGVSALEAAVAQAEVSKRAREEAAAAEAAADAGTASSEAAAASDADVQNGTGEVAAEPDEAAASADTNGVPATKRARVDDGAATAVSAAGGDNKGSRANSVVGMVRTKPSGDMRGHTGFLVFSTKHVG